MAPTTCPVCGMRVDSANMAAHMASGVAAHAVAKKGGGGTLPFGGKQAPPFKKKGA